MVYIACALYKEAEPIIKFFGLGFLSGKRGGSVYSNEDITLLITGVGCVPSAISLTCLLAEGSVEKNDIFINIGSAAGKMNDVLRTPGGIIQNLWSDTSDITAKENLGLYFCNKITEAATGRTFYPDMIYAKSDFADEKEVITVPAPMKRVESMDTLYDMEAAALYQTAVRWFSQENIFILKYISDEGTAADSDRSHPPHSSNEQTDIGEDKNCSKHESDSGTAADKDRNQSSHFKINVSPSESILKGITAFIKASVERSNSHTGSDSNSIIQQRVRKEALRLAELLNASETMRHEIYNLLLYREVASGDAEVFVNAFIKQYGLTEPVIRKTGKKLLINLKNNV